MFDETAAYGGNAPGMTQEKVFQTVSQTQKRPDPQESQLLCNIDLQVWNVVDVVDPAKPFHEDSNNAEGKRLSFDEEDVRTRARQCCNEGCKCKAEIIGHASNGGSSRCCIDPCSLHTYVRNHFAYTPFPPIPWKNLSRGIVRKCSEDLHIMSFL